MSGAERGIERGCFSVVGLWRQDIYPKFMYAAFSEKCPKAEKRSGGYRRGRAACPLLSPSGYLGWAVFAVPPTRFFRLKRSTGTFERGSLFEAVTRGSVLGRSPSKCFRISHPLLRFFCIKGISPSAEGDQRAPPFGNLQAFEKGLSETFSGWLPTVMMWLPKLYFSPVVLPSWGNSNTVSSVEVVGIYLLKSGAEGSGRRIFL